MSKTKDKIEFAYLMGKYSRASLSDVQRLMRYGATHFRLQEELTNGYKTHTQECDVSLGGFQKCTCGGVWDKQQTDLATLKCERIDYKIEQICENAGVSVTYGALHVSVVFTNSCERAIP